jgi:uracil-DNA glycosylase family protein
VEGNGAPAIPLERLREAEDEHESAAALLPSRLSLKGLQEAASGCRACPLWRGGTQTVFGEGRVGARVMLVGEQPGDREDLEGHPFVGPAGRVLDQALEEAGIDRDDAYVTNVVKHFKWKPRGKRRLHQKPNAEEIRACRPWLDSELEVIGPEVVVCLGATAAKALLGPSFRVTRERGKFVEPDFAPLATATVHPSSILRVQEEEERRIARREFTEDLRRVAERLG